MSSDCAVCGCSSIQLIDLPALPLTGLFTESAENILETHGHDLHWLFCSSCGHGQIANPLSPTILYGDQYNFRTGSSLTARKGAKFFRDWVLGIQPGRKYETIVEFGCNDASLLELFSGHAARRIGVDPVLAHLDAGRCDIELIPELIESVELAEICSGGPDLVICQHTLEHIVSPARLLKNLLRQTKPDTLFVFEFPCLDVLLDHGRFDQIFHEHVQYFSVQSASALLCSFGLEVVEFGFNFSHWGALLVAFRVGKSGDRGLSKAFPKISVSRLERAWMAFQSQVAAFRELTSPAAPGPLVGYGAALMLPVLNYHFRFVQAGLNRVIDDDPFRQGLWYKNLPIQIVDAGSVDFLKATVVLTAPDNRRTILRRLADIAPYRIVSPLLAM